MASDSHLARVVGVCIQYTSNGSANVSMVRVNQSFVHMIRVVDLNLLGYSGANYIIRGLTDLDGLLYSWASN